MTTLQLLAELERTQAILEREETERDDARFMLEIAEACYRDAKREFESALQAVNSDAQRI